MFNHKLILSTLVAGCLSLGSALAQDKPSLTDEQKAKLEEIKARFEAMRAGHGGPDSLGDAGKEGFRHRMGARPDADGPLSEERKALHEDIKALVEESKARMAADGADKEAIAAELKEKIKALTEAFRAEHKAALGFAQGRSPGRDRGPQGRMGEAPGGREGPLPGGPPQGNRRGSWRQAASHSRARSRS